MKQKAEEHLPSYRVRPRFQVETKISMEEVIEKIKKNLENKNATCKGWINHSGYGVISIPIEDQHYWSPQLTLSLEPLEKGGCKIRGMYGPRSSVWTMFVFFYFVIGFSIVVISVIGLANLFLNKPGLILWLVPVLSLIFLSLYLVSYTGQKFGHDQMVTLHQFIEESTGLDIIN